MKVSLAGSVLLAAFLFGTASCVEAGRACPSPTEEYESVIQWAHLVGPADAPRVVIGGHRSVECFTLDEGRLGTRYCSSRDVDQGAFSLVGQEAKLGVQEGANGVTVIAAAHAITVTGEGGTGRLQPWEPPSGVAPERFGLRAAYAGEGMTWVVWAGRDATGAETVVGLGRLEGRRVVAMGDPFHRATAVQPGDVPVVGGLDPDTGHLWLEDPAGDRVLEFDAAGALVGSVAHGDPVSSEVPGTPTHWTKLPDGRWAGFIGQWLCTFQPTDRSTQRCSRISWGEAIPEGYLIPLDLRVGAGGDLLIVAHHSPDDPERSTGLVIARWKADGTLPGAFTEHRIPECGILFRLR